MLDPSNIMMAAAIMPLFIVTYCFGKRNGYNETLELVLNVLIQEGMIVDDKDISGEFD